MECKYLYQVLPFLNEIDKKKRERFEEYFYSAPVWLMDSFQIVELDAGVVFVKENTPVDTIYIIGRGMIKATDYRIYGITYDFMRFEGVYAMGGMEVIMDLDRYCILSCGNLYKICKKWHFVCGQYPSGTFGIFRALCEDDQQGGKEIRGEWMDHEKRK